MGDNKAAQGHPACLKRVEAMVGAIRRFTRMVRLEEGLISLAALEPSQAPMNEHNARMHELAPLHGSPLHLRGHSVSSETPVLKLGPKARFCSWTRARQRAPKVTESDPGIPELVM